ncbi:MAG: hypothetical protein GF364_11000 [Candidatus Lokiarchaeota archaeon]|nr:hypothetical protein [Candidatus Lokiarchaeota archaeon]
MTLFTVVLIEKNVLAESERNLPTSISEFDSIEYFIEFRPKYSNKRTTNYKLTFRENSNNFLNISVEYEDLELTRQRNNFDYDLYLHTDGQWRIDNVSDEDNYDYMHGEYSELLCNISLPIKTLQKFRNDNFLIFVNYLRTDQKIPILQSMTRDYQYIDSETYSRNLLFEFNTNHFRSEWSFLSAGCS